MRTALKIAYQEGYKLGLRVSLKGQYDYLLNDIQDDKHVPFLDDDSYAYDGPYIDNPPDCPICGDPMHVSINARRRPGHAERYKPDWVQMECVNRNPPREAEGRDGNCAAYMITTVDEDFERSNSPYWQQIHKIQDQLAQEHGAQN